jgi:hypothetical protein
MVCAAARKICAGRHHGKNQTKNLLVLFLTMAVCSIFSPQLSRLFFGCLAAFSSLPAIMAMRQRSSPG